MLRILFDNDVDWRLRHAFKGRGRLVLRSAELGWARKTNGALLDLAGRYEPRFDAIITRDKDMRPEQAHRALA